MTRKPNFLCTGLCTATLLLAATGAMAAGKTQDPAVTGQNNQCWGQVASGLAQFDSPNYDASTMNGGGMGMHARSQTGADINGGFNSTTSVFGIHQTDLKASGDNAGRAGVGNVSAGFPHNTAPGDGGNGQHATNNGEFFSTIADPVTGTLMGGTGEPIECDLLDQGIVP
ncbi:hypothetical protein [Microvirga pakistanensis]|uniref:hypothetical protein n=1 Tax=Microvirga pakistanensis TaxID=1682650 RepID=UPI00141B9A7D|nr:hypothetical protein [Microvirga pakistanensis]